MKYALIIAMALCQVSYSQITKKTLFLGNSYIYSNDMPAMISSLATADGNTLIKDQNTPGGYTLQGHSTNATTHTKIANNNWDFVILQEQSQLPSFPWSQVTSDVFPYAEILCDSIRAANPCAYPIFFDTWGRRDGDPQWDSINTFDKMNARLLNGYTTMSDMNSTLMAPVGVGFDHVHNDGASPITHAALYSGDGSHPSVYGTYLAACVFYEIVFSSSSVGNTYVPGGITGSEATYLQGVAHHILNDVDSIDLDFTSPEADFSFMSSGTNVTFTNLSQHSFDWSWDFDNGSNSTDENPVHDFGAYGSFDVTLTSNYCGKSDDTTITVNISAAGIDETAETFELFPNPSESGAINISVQSPTLVEIFELSGKNIRNEFISGKSEIQLESGIYLVRVGNQIKKLIVL